MELFFLISFLDCSMSSVYVLCVLFILMTHCKKIKEGKERLLKFCHVPVMVLGIFTCYLTFSYDTLCTLGFDFLDKNQCQFKQCRSLINAVYIELLP